MFFPLMRNVPSLYSHREPDPDRPDDLHIWDPLGQYHGVEPMLSPPRLHYNMPSIYEVRPGHPAGGHRYDHDEKMVDAPFAPEHLENSAAADVLMEDRPAPNLEQPPENPAAASNMVADGLVPIAEEPSRRRGRGRPRSRPDLKGARQGNLQEILSSHVQSIPRQSAPEEIEPGKSSLRRSVSRRHRSEHKTGHGRRRAVGMLDQPRENLFDPGRMSVEEQIVHLRQKVREAQNAEARQRTWSRFAMITVTEATNRVNIPKAQELRRKTKGLLKEADKNAAKCIPYGPLDGPDKLCIRLVEARWRFKVERDRVQRAAVELIELKNESPSVFTFDQASLEEVMAKIQADEEADLGTQRPYHVLPSLRDRVRESDGSYTPGKLIQATQPVRITVHHMPEVRLPIIIAPQDDKKPVPIRPHSRPTNDSQPTAPALDKASHRKRRSRPAPRPTPRPSAPKGLTLREILSGTSPGGGNQNRPSPSKAPQINMSIANIFGQGFTNRTDKRENNISHAFGLKGKHVETLPSGISRKPSGPAHANSVATFHHPGTPNGSPESGSPLKMPDGNDGALVHDSFLHLSRPQTPLALPPQTNVGKSPPGAAQHQPSSMLRFHSPILKDPFQVDAGMDFSTVQRSGGPTQRQAPVPEKNNLFLSAIQSQWPPKAIPGYSKQLDIAGLGETVSRTTATPLAEGIRVGSYMGNSMLPQAPSSSPSRNAKISQAFAPIGTPTQGRDPQYGFQQMDVMRTPTPNRTARHIQPKHFASESNAPAPSSSSTIPMDLDSSPPVTFQFQHGD
ncbi:hypothetical protein MKZ38_009218 [Zalerion maritima]|uniref:Uncharacterized protein n=1 Tax=Zalerion maritima TaxID=339359 RepID=A0AAD5RG27_9PEZI|nr:hypothetical protein MKZ38_009218 [Zalerion maritima]